MIRERVTTEDDRGQNPGVYIRRAGVLFGHPYSAELRRSEKWGRQINVRMRFPEKDTESHLVYATRDGHGKIAVVASKTGGQNKFKAVKKVRFK